MIVPEAGIVIDFACKTNFYWPIILLPAKDMSKDGGSPKPLTELSSCQAALAGESAAAHH